jgi:hypothetical protein
METDISTEPKSAFRTTEFWVMVITQVVSILSMAGVLTSAQADALGKTLPMVIGGVLSIASAFGYTWSRIQVKGMRTQILTSANGAVNAPVMMKRAGL